jgi:cell division protein ZapA
LATTNSTTTEVRIYGASYQVRGSDENGYLQELADLVDGKMREVAKHLASADTAKVAILAALNLADELSRAMKQQDGEQGEIKEKAAELAAELSRALEG